MASASDDNIQQVSKASQASKASQVSKASQASQTSHGSLRTKSLVRLAYKLIDHFPELTLFGGFVRDIIIPGIQQYKNPFYSGNYDELPEISDIDILCPKEFDLPYSKMNEWED